MKTEAVSFFADTRSSIPTEVFALLATKKATIIEVETEKTHLATVKGIVYEFSDKSTVLIQDIEIPGKLPTLIIKPVNLRKYLQGGKSLCAVS